MLQVLDAAAVRRWCALGLEALRRARDEIDGLNVYPVPDGDTGTNLVLTMEAVQAALRTAGPGPRDTARAVTTGALLGARGNSGVILAQVLRGLCEALLDEGDGAGDAGPAALREGLRRAADLAWA
ncbi:MAG: DAK2 domain-containing protein, partial [Actinomycetota bacterium]|nr:DAK2 domain-containing protein [Actinomycetota bacterium]